MLDCLTFLSGFKFRNCLNCVSTAKIFHNVVSLPIVDKHQSVSIEGIAEGKLIFLCLRGGYNAVFPVCQDLQESHLSLIPWPLCETQGINRHSPLSAVLCQRLALFPVIWLVLLKTLEITCESSVILPFPKGIEPCIYSFCCLNELSYCSHTRKTNYRLFSINREPVRVWCAVPQVEQRGEQD